MNTIRQRMIEDMQLHGYSAKTQTAYLGAVRGLVGHYRRFPGNITQEEGRSYFLYLVKKKGVASSTPLKLQSFLMTFQNQVLKIL